MRCTQLEGALATAQEKVREQATGMQNGSHTEASGNKAAPPEATADAAEESAAEEMELQERLLDVQQQLVKERDHSAALLEDATRLETSSADAASAAQTEAAAAEVRQSHPPCLRKLVQLVLCMPS